jgi:carboxyl-terminal processing protease
MANDIITHVDEESMQGLTLDQAVDKIRGPVNTNIKLNITRKGQEKPIQVSVTREIIRVRSVRSHLEGGDVGFVRITQFNELTADGLKKAIADLTTQSRDKLRGFIIDLRHRSVGISRGKVLSRPARNPISLRTQRTIEPFVLRSI